MNDIQKKLLEIAKLYIEICEKLNLRYFAIGGTCLGAVRHNGFIPWDDDMDFGMPRKDYEIFEREAQKLLPNFYFVQTHNTDKEYYYPFMKIRDSRTTAIEDEMKEFNINHGLWIDIFPLDGLPDSFDKIDKISKKNHDLFRRRYLSFYYINNKYFYSKLKKCYSIIRFPTKNLAFNAELRNSKKYDFDKSIYFWWNWSNLIKCHFKTAWFSDYILLDFENVKFRIPYMYDKYLTEHYGDWRKLPPIEQQVSLHKFFILDLKKSYREIENKFNYE